MVWDIDNTLLTGIYLESPGSRRRRRPGLAAVLADWGPGHPARPRQQEPARGGRAHGARHRRRFAAAECGWGRKSDALAQDRGRAGHRGGRARFVDDDPRAGRGRSALPGVLVLSPEEAVEAAGWPEFSPPVVTAEARRRGEMYAERQRRPGGRRRSAAPGRSSCGTAGTRVTIASATAADVPRLHELSVRTRQFNSARPGGTSAVGRGA